MEALELHEQRRSDEASVFLHSENDTSAIKTLKGPYASSALQDSAPTSFMNTLAPDLMNSLGSSWVYQRNNALDTSRLSLYSRDTCLMAWSCLSGRSLAEISNVSVIGLPVMTDEIFNPMRSKQTWLNSTVDIDGPDSSVPKMPAQHDAVKSSEGKPSFHLPINNGSAQSNPIWTDVRFRCTGCGGNTIGTRCFSINGNRWHPECFPCRYCDNIIDYETNVKVLLRKDGSLTCRTCISSCKICGCKSSLMGGPGVCLKCFMNPKFEHIPRDPA